MYDEEARVTDTLRDKITSKMEVAKFFSGFITVLMGFLLKPEGGLDTPLSKIGIVALSSSLAFCVAAMFTYDHLLWPKESVANFNKDEISQAHFRKYLEANMVSLWWWLFVPAVALFGIGFNLFLMQALGPAKQGDSQGNVNIWRVSLLLAVVLPALLCYRKWPRIKNVSSS
jgi:hypothetical protein